MSTSPGFFINLFCFSNHNCLHQQDHFRNDQKRIQNQIKNFVNTSFKAKLAIFWKPKHPIWAWQCQVYHWIDDLNLDLNDFVALCSTWLEKRASVQGSGTTRERSKWQGRKALALPKRKFWVSSQQFPLPEQELRSLRSPLPRGQETRGVSHQPTESFHPLQPHQSLSRALKAIQASERNGSINCTGDTFKPFLGDRKSFKQAALLDGHSSQIIKLAATHREQ